MQPIGAYDDVAGHGVTVLEADGDRVCRLSDPDGASIEPHCVDG